MNAKLRAVTARIIAQVNREQPADAMLRSELRGQKEISREDSRVISQAVFTYYRWLGWLDNDTPLDNGIERALELASEFESQPDRFANDLRRAVPGWIFGHAEAAPEWLAWLQQRPKLWLRARRGRAAALAAKLQDTQPGPLPDSLIYLGKNDLFRVEAFQAGEFQLQDISSQAVSFICAPQPHQLWWDACAGEGGKLLHMSDLMQNKGSIWATDRVKWRLQRLKLRARRSQVFNYRMALWEGGPNLPTDIRFDGVLVDAPCSGLGTWQRNPHARWTTTPQDVLELAEVQKKLLSQVTTAMKPGAKLVYAACTTTGEETVQVQEAFAQAHPDFQPCPFANPFTPDKPAVASLRLWPQECGGNAMFVAAWKKREA
jgi:16S rRNA (cytosine967-C5)-methyltransferase